MHKVETPRLSHVPEVEGLQCEGLAAEARMEDPRCAHSKLGLCSGAKINATKQA